MKTIFPFTIALRLAPTVSALAMVLVPVAPSVGHAAVCTAGLNAAYTDGDYLFLNKANLTSVFQISTGTWVGQVDLDSPAYWNQPNAPFEGGRRGQDSDIDAMFMFNGVVHVIRGTTAYRYDGSQWWPPVDVNDESHWRQSGGPFEGGDMRSIDAAYVYGEAVFIIRDTKAYTFDFPNGRWLTPVELNAPQYWAQLNAPFEFNITRIDDAFVQGPYIVIQRDTKAYLFEPGVGWLTPVELKAPQYWAQPNAPFSGPRIVVRCDQPIGGSSNTTGSPTYPFGPPLGSTTDKPTAPAAPTMLEVKPTAPDSISLSWKDNSDIETGFAILRDGTQVMTVSANGTTATVTGLIAGQGYCFEVKSFTRGSFSLPSNQACTITEAVGPTGKIQVNLLKPSNITTCGSATIRVAGRTKTVAGKWTGSPQFVGHCIYATEFTDIPEGRQTVTSPDFYACGIAYVTPNVPWFMRLDWYTNRCYR